MESEEEINNQETWTFATSTAKVLKNCLLTAAIKVKQLLALDSQTRISPAWVTVHSKLAVVKWTEWSITGNASPHFWKLGVRGGIPWEGEILWDI